MEPATIAVAVAMISTWDFCAFVACKNFCRCSAAHSGRVIAVIVAARLRYVDNYATMEMQFCFAKLFAGFEFTLQNNIKYFESSGKLRV